MFLSIQYDLFLMKFERRDLILIAGLILGDAWINSILRTCLFCNYSNWTCILVSKIYVGKKRQLIEQDVGEGICMECGSKITK